MQAMVPAGADRIWAEDSGGSGPVLVLLHEGVGDSRMWDPVWPALAARFRVIRYDVRGYGQSPLATQDYSLLGDLRIVLGYFGVERAHLAGCSMGGLCALEFALAEPDRTDSLVLLAAGIGGYEYPMPPGLGERCEELAAAGDWDGVTRELLTVWGAAGDDPVVFGLMKSSLRASDNEEEFQQPGEPTRNRLAEITARTAILVGDLDFAPLVASNLEAAGRIPGCDLIVMPGVDHYPTIRVPDLVTETILRHCQ